MLQLSMFLQMLVVVVFLPAAIIAFPEQIVDLHICRFRFGDRE